MKSSLIRDIEAWESEGGAALARLGASVPLMKGTAAQVKWAEAASEFDRVTVLFRSIATNQGVDKRSDTKTIIDIVKDKRSEEMGRV